MTAEVELYQTPPRELAIPPASDIDSWIRVVQDIIKIANVIYDTPFVPDGLRGSAPAVAAAMLAGREMGLGIMTSLANIDVIKGKPTQKALLMRAMIQSKGHKWQDGDVSDVRAVVRGCRKGESEWTEVVFTAAQAKTAGIDLGRYPADKLYARATSRLARRKFADVIMGMPYSSEEAEDGAADEGTVTEQPATATPPAAAPRTARRRQAPQDGPEPPDPTPASAAAPASGSATTQQAAPAQTARPPSKPDGPPLPGEDDDRADTVIRREAAKLPDPDPGEHGTATTGKGGQLTALWTILSQVYEFTAEEKPQARAVCEHIIGRQLPGNTTGDLSYGEARVVLDTLANWQSVAAAQGMTPRAHLLAMLAAGEPGSGDGNA